MHHFEKILSASWALSPDLYRVAAPGPCWGTSILQTPSLPTPGKNPAGAHECKFLCACIILCNVCSLSFPGPYRRDCVLSCAVL